MTKEEAIKELRGFIGQLTEGCQEAIKVLIPELKESNDERIRKDLIKYLESDRDCQPCQDVSFYDSSIAWLEKQGQQKPAGWSEDDEDKLMDILEMIKYTDVLPPTDIPSCTGHLHLSNEYKEKLSSWLKTRLKSFQPQSKQEWSEEDKFKLEDAITGIDVGIGFYETEGKHPNLLKAIIEAKDWLKSLRPQSKQEWGEEDEKMRKNIIQVLKSFVSQAECESNPSISTSYPTYWKEIDWLESFSPQSKVEWSEKAQEILNEYPKTLEQTAKEYSEKTAVKVWGKIDINKDFRGYLARGIYATGLKDGFQAGAKWQRKQDELTVDDR